MVQHRGELGLVEEHRDEPLIARAFADDRLQDDVALERAEPGLARQINLRHAAGREVTQHVHASDLFSPSVRTRVGFDSLLTSSADGVPWRVGI